VCGNGGSAADAEHIVGELMKGFCLSRPLTPVQRQALSDAFPEEGPALADSLQQAVPGESTGHPGTHLPVYHALCAALEQALFGA
jgi:D-sedoheptulose 7-phosphate isomerase